MLLEQGDPSLFSKESVTKYKMAVTKLELSSFVGEEPIG